MLATAFGHHKAGNLIVLAESYHPNSRLKSVAKGRDLTGSKRPGYYNGGEEGLHQHSWRTWYVEPFATVDG